MKKIEIVIPVKPVPFARPRFGKSKQVFEPKRYADFKSIVAWHVLDFMAFKNFQMFSESCAVSVDFFKKNQAVTSRNWGDLDNFLKAVLDALNGVLWVDDSIITQIAGSKHFADESKMVVKAWGW